MDISVTQKGKVSLVTFAGTIDATSVDGVGSALSAQVKAGATRIVGDLTGVDYTNSAGLRTLLITLKETQKKGGDFRLAGLQENVHRAFELGGFLSLFKIFGSADAAVASFEG